MHTKTDSDMTSLAASTPPRSPPRRGPGAVYYVESPSHPDVDKMSYGSSPMGSPTRHYHCSPIHHSRESSTSRFSSSLLKNQRPGWRRIHGRRLGYSGAVEGELEEGVEVEEEDDDGGDNGGPSVKFYVGCFLVSFVGLFALFSLILWGASKSFRPQILVKNMTFWNLNIQAGMDGSGVPTDMLTLNSTVRISYKNPGTFFGVHVTSTPMELYYYDLRVASGQMKNFYQKRKSLSMVTTVVHVRQIPLYGGMSVVSNARKGNTVDADKVSVGMNLTFTVRSKAYILGRLVKSKFNKDIRCPVTLDGTHLGKSVNLIHSCIYD